MPKLFTFTPAGPWSPWPRFVASPRLASARYLPAGGAFYGLPEREDYYVEPVQAHVDSDMVQPETKRGSVTTSADPLACKLRQFQRIAGINGVSPLAERYEPDGLGCKVRWRPSARGSSTHTVNLDNTGLSPREQVGVAYDKPGSFDMAYVARYRNEYKGEAFTKSAKLSDNKRAREWFTKAFPYWPLDSRGHPMPGKVTRDGTDRYFDMPNGVRVYLSALHSAHLADEKWTDDCADELRRLQEEHEADKAHDKRHSKRTRMAW